MPQYDVDLRDYWRIIKKRKAIIVLMVLLVGICSYGFARLKEPEPLFRATAAIKIEQMTSMASVLMGAFWFRTDNMVTHAYIVTSYPVLEHTAKMLGWIPKDLAEDEIRKSKEYLYVIKRLKSSITAEQETGTNIVNVQVVSKKPLEAARIANAVTQAYRGYNIQERNRQTIETKAFIEDQLEITSKNLKQAERELQSFREGYALISLSEQTKNTLDRIYDVESEYDKLRAQKREVGSQLRLIRKMTTESPDDLMDSLFSADSNSPVFGLKAKMSDLLLKRQTLLIHLTEKHPQVVEIDDQVQAVIQEVRKELEALHRMLKAREIDLLKKLSQLKKQKQSLPEKSLQLARLQREVGLQETLYSELKAKHQETLIQESGQIEEVSIVRPAAIPDAPFNIPSKFMIVVTGIVMGLILGVVSAFGVEVFDTSMGTIEDVEESLQVPVLGAIPYLGIDHKEKGKKDKEVSEKERARDLITHYDPKSLAAEAFRHLRTNLQFMSLESKGKTFLVTSSFVKEGKTLNVLNLALSVAQAGEKVLLVEADLRKPLIHRNFGLSKEPGLTDFVLGNYTWQEVVNNISDVMLGDFEIEDILKTPGLDNLHIITAGTRPPNPTEILSSARFREFIKEAGQKYNFVFFDAPPILPVADATEIAPLVDGVILVYTVGRIGRGVLKRAKSSLDNVDAKVLGVILNNVKPEIGPDYFKYHSQHYYGPEDETQPPRKTNIKDLFQRLVKFASGRRFIPLVAVLIALTLLLFGIFWQDIF
jgi:capsular exopolysaccharide synthesis family protein